MKGYSFLLVSLLALNTVNADAGPDAQKSIEVGYVGSRIDVSGPMVVSEDWDGHGWVIAGRLDLAEPIFLVADYQAVALGGDFRDVDLDQLRLGTGFTLHRDESTVVNGVVQYVSLTSEDSEGDGDTNGGPALHIEGAMRAANMLWLNASVGYLDIEDWDGIEWSAGINVPVSDGIEVFCRYRSTSLEASDLELDLADTRAGLRLYF